jgi:elongation factor Tu
MDTDTKPHVTVGTIGDFDHGKTTLSAAISARQAFRFGTNALTYEDIARGGTVRDKDKIVTHNASRFEYETARRHYAHVDCPSQAGNIRSMINADLMDGAILVVSAADGPMPHTHEQIVIAWQMGVSRLVVFLNKVDLVDDPELLELVEMEVRELLHKYEFPGDEVPIIRGNAKAALDSGGKDDDACRCIDELMDALDAYVLLPERQVDGPFLMRIEDVFSIKGRGIVCTGRIERGTIKAGDEVEIIGLMKSPKKTVVTAVEMFHKTLEQGIVGDHVGIFLRGIERTELERGQVLAQPGMVTAHTRFTAIIYVLKRDEGGRHTPLFTGYRPQFYFRRFDMTGTIELPECVEMCLPGSHVTVTVNLNEPIVLDEGQRFVARESGRTVGAGRVVRILQ